MPRQGYCSPSGDSIGTGNWISPANQGRRSRLHRCRGAASPRHWNAPCRSGSRRNAPTPPVSRAPFSTAAAGTTSDPAGLSGSRAPADGAFPRRPSATTTGTTSPASSSGSPIRWSRRFRSDGSPATPGPPVSDQPPVRDAAQRQLAPRAAQLGLQPAGRAQAGSLLDPPWLRE